MPDDRDQILKRVTEALAPLKDRAALPDYDVGEALARNAAPPPDVVQLFTQRMTKLDGIVLTDPAALAATLDKGGWKRGYCDPALWPGLEAALAGLDVSLEFDRSRVDDYAFGITRAAGAIAETGTVILNDAVTSRRLAALAPWVHVAVVESAGIFPGMVQALGALGSDPNVIWCTGPSRTADVEGILIKGVHGPGVQIALVV